MHLAVPATLIFMRRVKSYAHHHNYETPKSEHWVVTGKEYLQLHSLSIGEPDAVRLIALHYT